MVHESWLGEFLYSDKRKENGTASTAIGIVINGNDHYVTNTIIFSSHIGWYRRDVECPLSVLQPRPRPTPLTRRAAFFFCHAA